MNDTNDDHELINYTQPWQNCFPTKEQLEKMGPIEDEKTKRIFQEGMKEERKLYVELGMEMPGDYCTFIIRPGNNCEQNCYDVNACRYIPARKDCSSIARRDSRSKGGENLAVCPGDCTVNCPKPCVEKCRQFESKDDEYLSYNTSTRQRLEYAPRFFPVSPVTLKKIQSDPEAKVTVMLQPWCYCGADCTLEVEGWIYNNEEDRLRLDLKCKYSDLWFVPDPSTDSTPVADPSHEKALSTQDEWDRIRAEAERLWQEDDKKKWTALKMAEYLKDHFKLAESRMPSTIGKHLQGLRESKGGRPTKE